MTTDRDQMRQAIQDQYGARAKRAGGEPAVGPDGDTGLVQLEMVGGDAADGAACCGDDCCVPQGLADGDRNLIKGIYAQDQVEGLPEAAVEAAAGCGNPTAIAEIQPGETLLDLGSGGGIDCFLAAAQTGPQGRVIGVDMTRAMLDMARRNASELGVSNVEFREGEIEALPVADATVDLIISNCVVNLSTDKDQTLREAFWVLRPGGRLRISDLVWRNQRPEGAGTLDEWAGCIAGAVSVSDLLASLGAAGFKSPRADALTDVSEHEGLASALISAEKR